MIAKSTHHFFGFTDAQKPMINNHTVKLIADRLVNKNRRNRWINPSGQLANHPRSANLIANGRNLRLSIRHQSRLRMFGNVQSTITGRNTCATKIDLGKPLRVLAVANLITFTLTLATSMRVTFWAGGRNATADLKLAEQEALSSSSERWFGSQLNNR